MAAEQESLEIYLKSPYSKEGNNNNTIDGSQSPVKKQILMKHSLSKGPSHQLSIIESNRELANESIIIQRRSLESKNNIDYQTLQQKQKVLDIDTQQEIYRGFTGLNKTKYDRGGQDKSRGSQFSITGTAFSPFNGAKENNNSGSYNKQNTMGGASSKNNSNLNNTGCSHKNLSKGIVSNNPTPQPLVKQSFGNIQTIRESQKLPNTYNSSSPINNHQVQNAQSTLSVQSNRYKKEKKQFDDLAHVLEGAETLEQLKNKYHHSNKKPAQQKKVSSVVTQLPSDFKLQGIQANMNSQANPYQAFQFQVLNGSGSGSPISILQQQNFQKEQTYISPRHQLPNKDQISSFVKTTPGQQEQFFSSPQKKSERANIHLPSPNFGGGATNLTQYMEMNQTINGVSKSEEDDYMPIDQYQKIMRETESLLLRTEDQETYRDTPQLIQISTPEKNQPKIDLNNANVQLQQRNPYRNIVKTDNNSNTSIFKAPIYLKESKKYYPQNLNKKLMPLQIITSDFDPQPFQQDLTGGAMLYGQHPLSTSNYDHGANSSTMLNMSNDSANAGAAAHCGFMFQSPPVKIPKDNVKIIKQKNVGMKKNLKLIKQDKERVDNDAKFQKIYDKLKINLEPIQEMQQAQISLAKYIGTLTQQQQSLNNSILEDRRSRDVYLSQLQNHSSMQVKKANNSSKFSKKSVDEFLSKQRSPANSRQSNQAILLLKHWQGTINDSPKHQRNEPYEGSFLSETNKISATHILPPIVSPASMRSNIQEVPTPLQQTVIMPQFSPAVFILNHAGIPNEQSKRFSDMNSKKPEKFSQLRQYYDQSDQANANQVRTPQQLQLLKNSLTGIHREQKLLQQINQSELRKSRGLEQQLIEYSRASNNHSYISNHHVYNSNQQTRGFLHHPDVSNLMKHQNMLDLQSSIQTSLARQRNSVGDKDASQHTLFKGSRNAFQAFKGTQEQKLIKGGTTTPVVLPLTVGSPHFISRSNFTTSQQGQYKKHEQNTPQKVYQMSQS